MQHKQTSQPSTSADSAPVRESSDMAGDALARRRLLLKGLAKGSAVAAAVAPVQSLMAQTSTERLCTVSGVQSNVGSGRTGGTTAKCQGNSISYFSTLSNWPGYNSVSSPNGSFTNGSTSGLTAQATFFAVFAGGSSGSLISIVTGSPASSEAIWVTALLNANKRTHDISVLGYFPYTPAEVVALYADNAKRSAAEAFFSGYLQGVN